MTLGAQTEIGPVKKKQKLIALELTPDCISQESAFQQGKEKEAMLTPILAFCLELLANIENLEDKLQNYIKFSHLKKVIRNFLWERVFKVKSTFDEYYSFINALNNIYANFGIQSFLNKQLFLIGRKKIPSPESLPPSSRWETIKTFVHSGLLVKNINLTEQAAQLKKISFKIILPIAKKEKLINLYNLKIKVNRLSPEYRKAAEWLVNHLQVLTFKDLCASMREACIELSKELQDKEGYHVLTVENKSQAWMADIALRYLPSNQLPTSIECMGSDEHCYKSLREIVSKAGSRNFVIFDDISYSGVQLSQFLDALGNLVYKGFEKIIINPITIYLVIGFVSDIAKVIIEEYIKVLAHDNIHVKFICVRNFKGIQGQCEAEGIDLELKQRIYSLSDGPGFDAHVTTRKTTITTVWKKPDWVSLPMFFSRYITEFDRFLKPEYKLLPESVPGLHLISHKVIKETIEPYKLPVAVDEVNDVLPAYKKNKRRR